MNTAILSILAFVLVLTLAGHAFANSNSTKTSDSNSKSDSNSNHVDKHSNYYKNCIKLTDKKTRSIICPDVFPKGESSFVPGG